MEKTNRITMEEKKLVIKPYTVLKAMENLTQEECKMAYDAFDLGEDLQGEFGGYCAAFAAGMKYGATKALAELQEEFSK